MNEGKLTTLSGPGASAPLPSLHDLSDFEAGLVVLSEMSAQFPGLSWDQFLMTAAPAGQMSGWWTDLKKATTSVVSGVGNIASSTIRFIGDMGGDALRLVTSSEVSATVQRAIAAYATGGGSEALKAILDQLPNMTPDQQQAAANQMGITREELLAIAGAGAAGKMGSADWMKWAMGAGILVVILGGAFWVMDRKK